MITVCKVSIKIDFQRNEVMPLLHGALQLCSVLMGGGYEMVLDDRVLLQVPTTGIIFPVISQQGYFALIFSDNLS